MPPTAAMTGRMALLKDDSCPSTISRLISNPTTKKNTTIKRSLTQCFNDSLNVSSPMEKPR